MNKKPSEMIESYSDCPTEKTTYDISGSTFIVTRHFVGDGDIDDIVREAAYRRADREFFDIEDPQA